MSTVLANRYKIEDDSDSLLGMGGMGVVMKGVDQATGQPVAVKILKDAGRGTAYDRELLERFLREGEALRRLNHPNVVKLLDTFEEKGRRYLIMELVPGGSLRDLLARGEKLHLSRFLQIAMDVCDALTRAHRLDIIHRDLKPDNVLLDGQGTARVTDFGVAHFEDRTQLTADGAMLGTVAYMSPEAVNGEPATAATDIWAFGVMLYELLAGERPFKGSNPATIISAILQHPVPALKGLRPHVPGELVNLLDRMLERKLDNRIASLREVGVELERLRAHPAFQPGAPETATPAAPPGLMTEVQSVAGKIIPLRLHLLGKFGPQQALQALDEANRIWNGHELVWNAVGCQPLVVDEAALLAAFPTHSKEPGHRKASCEALAAAPGYDPQAVNVYFTEEIRYQNKALRSSGQEFRDRRIVIVPEQHFNEPTGLTLARMLGIFLGLARNANTPEDRLVSLSGKGTTLTPDEVKEVKRRADKLLAVLVPATTGPVGAEIPVRLRVWLVRGGKYGTSLASPGMLDFSCWVPAGLRFEVDVQDLSVPDSDVAAVFPGDENTPGHKQNFGLLGKAGGTGINLFLIRELPSAGGKTSYVTVNDKAARVVVATEVASPRAVNRALGMFLGLAANDYALPSFLMGNGTGDRLHPDEIRTVRASAAKYPA